MDIQEDVLKLRIVNENLQSENNSLQESYANSEMNLQHIIDLLEQAEELLKEAQGYIENEDDELYDEIEQFLKEIEK